MALQKGEIFHGILILIGHVPQAQILIDTQALPIGVAADQLHLGVDDPN